MNRLLLMMAGIVAMTGHLAIGLVSSLPGLTQSPSGTGAAVSLNFDVASIKSSAIASAGGEGSRRENISSSPDTLTMANVSLASAIKWAYSLHDYQVAGPAWLNDERYDIRAKASSPTRNDQLRLMLRTLLADRFKLTFHRQTKELPVYALLVAKNGPKLHEAQGEPEGGVGLMTPNKVRMVAEKTSMSELADLLSGPLQTPVVDMTGLTARFDFTLDLTALITGDTRKQGEPAPDIDMASIIFRAVQDQLGLALRAQKAPVEIFVVDHADKVPTQD